MSSKMSIAAFPFSLTEVTTKRRKRVAYCSALALALAVLGVAAPARAQVTVGCAGASGTSNFTTLTAALAANPAGNVTIAVSGTCTEAVVVSGVQNLKISGNPGAALVDPGGSPPNFNAVLEIDNSQGVTIEFLLIQVASRPISTAVPVVLVQGSNVVFHGSRLEGAGASDGIDMFQSGVRLVGAVVIENNNDGQGNGSGVVVEGPAADLVLRRDPAGRCPLIQGNGSSGIEVNGGGAHVRAPFFGGCATIQNNGLAGILADEGATISLVLSEARAGAIQVLNNVLGVVARLGSHLIILGPVLIQGNALDGVRLRSNAAAEVGVFDGTSGPTVQQNGFSTTPVCCALPAGISVANNATLSISAGLITNNSAPGVLVQDDSSVRIIGPLTITQNPIGVQVTNVSTAALFFAPTITGNTTQDVVCGPESVAYGDLSAVGNITCPQFKPQANPPTPPKGGKPIP